MILFAAALLLPWCAGAAAPEKGAVPVIFETDMGNDIDDALALDLLYKGMDAGHIRLIGVSLNKRSSTSFEFTFAAKDLPLPGVPRISPLGFFSCLRSQSIMLFDSAFKP